MPTTASRRVVDLESFIAEQIGTCDPVSSPSLQPPAQRAVAPTSSSGTGRRATTVTATAAAATRKRGTQICAWVVGACLCASLVVGLLALADFWKRQEIQFTKGRGEEGILGVGPGYIEDLDSGGTLISLQELELHNRPREDCWVLFSDGVYDMTRFPRRHPGGEEFITRYCGKDGTRAFGLYHFPSRLRTVANERIGDFFLEEDEEISDTAEGAAISLSDYLMGGGRY